MELMAICISIYKQLEKKGRFRMFMYNAFPPLNKMLYTFPFLKKVPWLLPFCWIARWFYAIFTKPKNVVTKVKMFARVSKDVE